MSVELIINYNTGEVRHIFRIRKSNKCGIGMIYLILKHFVRFKK